MNTAAYEVDTGRNPGCEGDRASLPSVHRSVKVPSLASGASNSRRLLAFAGPGFLVAVGYMDPGNWATSLAGGSQFGYSLIGVIIGSNLIAMLLQTAAVRLGLASGLDLAQACRRHFHPALTLALWGGCEIAIVACNMAEILGMAIGLNLLLKIPLPIGVCLTAADVTLVLALQRRSFRCLEAFIIGLIALVGMCFAAQLWWLHPSALGIAKGMVPSTQLLSNAQMLYLAVGIVGATVMPHNLYLHSSIVQTRNYESSEPGRRHAIRFATIDSNAALGMALLVNVAILVLAAGVFHHPGQTSVTELSDAYRMLSPSLGVGIASAVFGIGLLASGLSSSVTGTLAGQIVMEGFLDLRMSRAARALLTRCFAIVPAAIVTVWFGGRGAGALLVFSQVVLSLQLPFAIGPLLWFTTRRKYLGTLAFGRSMSTLLWASALGVLSLNAWMLERLCSR